MNKYVSDGTVNAVKGERMIVGSPKVDWTNIGSGCIFAIAKNNISYQISKAEISDFSIPFISVADSENITVKASFRYLFHEGDEIKLNFGGKIKRRHIVGISESDKNKLILEMESPLAEEGDSSKIEGEIILSKWTLLLVEPYSGDTANGLFYGISSNKTECLGLPLVYIQDSPLCPIFNNAMLSIDNVIKEMKSIENMPKKSKICEDAQSIGFFEFSKENPEGFWILNKRAAFDYAIEEIYVQCDSGHSKISLILNDTKIEPHIIASKDGYELKDISILVPKGYKLGFSSNSPDGAKNLYISIVYKACKLI